MEKEVLVSIINSWGVILAATIPSIVGAIGIRKAFNRKKLREELLQAYRDLKFMNEIEELALERLQETGKIKLREKVTEKLGYKRSRNAERARIEARILELEKLIG